MVIAYVLVWHDSRDCESHSQEVEGVFLSRRAAEEFIKNFNASNAGHHGPIHTEGEFIDSDTWFEIEEHSAEE